MQSWTKSVKLTEPVMQSIGVFDASVLHSYRWYIQIDSKCLGSIQREDSGLEFRIET